jgi:hypothetical protein
MGLSPAEMRLAIIANLEKQTGRTLDGWIAVLKQEAPAGNKTALTLLKQAGLGHFQALIVAKEHESQRQHKPK